MQMRTYALTLVAAGVGLFVVVVAANFVIDPNHVFGTGLLPRAPNANDRYEKLLVYQSAPQKYDGLVFGSSRAFAISLDDLSRSMDGLNFASFAVVGGMLVDHIAALEFVLRDKTARGERLRGVLLLIDADVIGRRPFTNQSNQFLMPPALSGENPARFWWKNLVTIQFKAWNSALRSARNSRSNKRREVTSARTLPEMISELGPVAANAQSLPVAVPTPKPNEREHITKRSQYGRQLKLLEQFVALCRKHDIRVEVATTPLSNAIYTLYDPADLRSAIEDISRIVPLWDFTNSESVSDDADMWADPSHFRAEVGDLMLRRMFNRAMPPAWTSFGRRLQP